MPHIDLTEAQMRILAETEGSVEVRDPEGRVVSFLKRLDPMDVEAIIRYRNRKDSSQPSISSARVGALLRKAHEIDAREGMTPEKMKELLHRVRAGEDPKQNQPWDI